MVATAGAQGAFFASFWQSRNPQAPAMWNISASTLVMMVTKVNHKS
jgi:hypothetical protein